MPWWWSLVALTALALLVGLRRLRARAWNAPTSPAANDGRFRAVWFQTTAPRASFFSFKDRRTGSLTVHSARSCAEFTGRGEEVVTLANVRDVRMGGRGSDFVNTWIEVVYDAPPGIAFVNDARLLGWWALLSGSNTRIARALAGLVEHPARPRN